ncbi:uncharacterized protein [Clytia hemisphaerica]|uniref:uncharacterized protein n=1 Tax=Clytia hemisphaerica TaxID=252671 RepID=UPI0034D544C2
MRKVNKELGGTLKATSSGSLPRNNCQVRNLNRANKGETSKKDTLAMMMEECKKTMKSSRYFIRRVEGAPEPMCIIGSEAAFQDLDRYCCKMPQGLNSVLTVDPTFNFGDFFFTPITYQNLAVLRKSTNKPKIDMGPALIHYRKMFSSYHYFSSSLVGIHPELSELKCFGTDGEATLQSAFSKTFPFSDQLRCFIHSKRNVEEKLKELALPMTSKQTIIHDIFGKVEGTHKIEGLAHAPDANMFDIYVESIKNKWDDIELPHVPKNQSPKFHEWFTKNVVPYMRSHMLTNIRQRNGISEDFSTNQSESLNAKIAGKQRDSYYNLPDDERITVEKAFYESTVSDQDETPDEGIPGIDCTYSKNIIAKAERIIAAGGVVPFAESGTYHVINTDSSRPHYVKRKKDGSFTCDDRTYAPVVWDSTEAVFVPIHTQSQRYQAN